MSRDMDRKEQPASRKAVIASRDAVNPKACQLVRDLPLHPMALVALSAGKSHSSDQQAGSASEGEQVEVICRTGDLVRELSDVVQSDDVAVTVLFEENDSSQCRLQLAKDAAAILRKTHKPVLVAAGVYGGSTKGSILVAAGGSANRTKLAGCHIDRLANMDGAEVVVLSVASPFRPAFSRVAVSMHSYYGSAVHEVHDEQTQDAIADSMCLCEALRASGAKSWAIGKVGKFVPETLNAAESCNCALICVPLDNAEIAHERQVRTLLVELLGSGNIPILMLPPEARAR